MSDVHIVDAARGKALLSLTVQDMAMCVAVTPQAKPEGHSLP